MTNQTYVATGTNVATVFANINHFVVLGIPLGYINFEIKPPIVTPQYAVGGLPTGQNVFTIMVNYYDPAIM